MAETALRSSQLDFLRNVGTKRRQVGALQGGLEFNFQVTEAIRLIIAARVCARPQQRWNRTSESDVRTI